MPNPYSVGNAPEGGSYTPPRVDFSWLGDLPQTYYAGAAARRQKAMAEAFPEGMPTNPDGTPNFEEMTNRVMKIGGLEAAGPMIQQMMQLKLGQIAGGAMNTGLGGEGDLPGPSPRAAAPQPTPGGPRGPNTGPDHLRPPVAQAGYNSEGDSIRSLVTERLPGADGQNLINYLSGKAFPGDENGADRTLNADQTAAMGKAIEGYKTQQAQRAQQPQPQQSGTQPTAQGGVPAQQPQAGAAGPTPGPGPAPSGPYTGTAGFAAGGPTSPAVPPQFSPALRTQLEARYRDLATRAAAIAGVNPQASQRMQSAMQALQERIKLIDEYWSKRTMPTGEMQNATAGGFRSPAEAQLAIKGQEQETTEGQKQYAALAAGGRAYEVDLKPLFGAARAFLNDPNMWSGTGGQFSLFVNKLKNLAGTNPNAALAQEGLSKITSMTTLANLNQQKYDLAEMGQGQAGRIFAQQVDLVTKTAPGLENTIPGNLLLVEINDRLGALRSKMAEMARQDIQAQRAAGNKNPHLIPDQFDAKVAKYLQDHPIFSKAELANPRLIAPPVFKTPDDLRSAGLPSGSPFKTSDGRIKYVP